MSWVIEIVRRKFGAKKILQDEPREAYDPIRQRMEFHGNLVERLDEESDPARRERLQNQMSRLRNLARYRTLPRSRW